METKLKTSFRQSHQLMRLPSSRFFVAFSMQMTGTFPLKRLAKRLQIQPKPANR